MSSGHDQHIRGELMRQQGRYDDAVGYFKEALSANPDNDSAFAELAMCYMEMEGHRKDALTAIEDAIALDPEDGWYRSIKSLALSRLERGKEALVAADEAIALDPEEAFAYTVKAQAYMTLERWGMRRNRRNGHWFSMVTINLPVIYWLWPCGSRASNGRTTKRLINCCQTIPKMRWLILTRGGQLFRNVTVKKRKSILKKLCD